MIVRKVKQMNFTDHEERIVIDLTVDEAAILLEELPTPEFVQADTPAPMYGRFYERVTAVIRAKENGG